MPISICIVEDQIEIRNSLVRIIQNEPDFELLASYGSADDACTELIRLNPDVVIMDINLPGKLNGIDCVRSIKDKGNTSQILMFTIYEEDEKIFDAIQAGASGYLLKKTQAEKIIDGVKELYSGGSPMNMSIARKVISFFQQKEKGLKELTDKQNEILSLLSKGYLYKEIANKLCITTGTVTQHIHSIYERLHVSNKTEAINKFLHKS